MLRKLILVPCLSLGLLGGCAWAPGMHLAEKNLWDQDSAQGKGDSAPLAGIEKIELTAKTIALETRSVPKIPAELLVYQPGEYRLGSRDLIQMVVWDHPELTTPAGATGDSSGNAREIDTAGNVFVPYVGAVRVAGLTLSEARQEITTRLARFIEKPQIDIVVKTYASQRFTVGGEVLKPGMQVIGSQSINLLDAIGLAGGFTELADQTRVTLVRGGQRYTLNLAGLMQELSADIARVYMQAGDVIQVADNTSQKAYVIGEVNKPQPVPFTTHGLTLTDALGAAGGVSQLFSNAGSIYVIRSAGAKGKSAQLYHLDAASPVALVVADNFQLRARDVVFVGTASITRWNRVVSQLLPSMSVVSSADKLGN